jgi:hypothetical protein
MSIVRFLALPLLLTIGTGTGFAQIYIGDPATDGGWTYDGISSSAGNIMLNANNSANFSANVYSTAFTLGAGSTLLGPLGTASGWSVGDTIVGVGGVFNATGNSSLTYSGSSGDVNLHLVVKYGSPTASWTLSGAGFAAGTAGALANGGTGALLLGSLQGTIGPSTGLTTPADAPTFYNGSTLPPGTGIEGQVLTFWTGSALTGFETFLDLNVLAANAPAANVALGDEFVLDLQQNSGVFQDSLGNLPSVLVPEPTTLRLGTLLLLPFAVSRVLRVLRKKQMA